MNEKKRARGEGRLFIRGNIWWLQYYDRGQQIRVSSGTGDRKKAERTLRRKTGEVAAGVHRDTRRITYEGLRETYYSDYQIASRKSLRRDAEGKPYLDKVLRLDRFFSGYRAQDIDADLIRKFIANEQRRNLANGTVNRSISALRRMFNLAKRDGKLRDVPYFPMLKEAAPRQGFFEPDQYEKLSRSLPDYLRLPLALGYYTGMRRDEILCLEWSQVDFLACTITLRSGTTKNDEGRTIPIVPQLRALLIEERATRQPDFPLVCFRLDRGGHAVKIGSFRKVWQSRCLALKLGSREPAIDAVTGEHLFEKPRGPRSKPKAKMVYRGMLFHDLRRTAVRNLVRAGVPERVAQKITGHKTRSTFERYNITSVNDVIDAGRKLEIFHRSKVRDNSGTVSTELQQVSSSIN